MQTILLVTWIEAGAAQSNFQVTSDTREACLDAAAAIGKDAQRLAAEYKPVDVSSGSGTITVQPPYPPHVSAICADKGS